jgi:hypothetical protein
MRHERHTAESRHGLRIRRFDRKEVIMTPLLEHAFIRQYADDPPAADSSPGSRPARTGVCRRLCATHDPALESADRKLNEHIHAAAPPPDRMASGVGILRQFASMQSDTVTTADIVQFGMRIGNAMNSATPLLNVWVQLVDGASLDVGANVVLERPGAAKLRCVVAQRLSRVNRYRLTAVEPEQTAH